MGANERSSDQELVEVLDDEGRIVRLATRAEMRSGRLRHRCTSVVVRSSRGEVLVHRRSPGKDLWPGMWDLSCGGVVQVGEEWLDAARRELFEELGILVGPGDLEQLGEGVYEDPDVSELARVWTVTHDGPFTFTDGEVAEVRFVALDELRGLLEVERFVPDSVALALPLLR